MFRSAVFFVPRHSFNNVFCSFLPHNSYVLHAILIPYYVLTVTPFYSVPTRLFWPLIEVVDVDTSQELWSTSETPSIQFDLIFWSNNYLFCSFQHLFIISSDHSDQILGLETRFWIAFSSFCFLSPYYDIWSRFLISHFSLSKILCLWPFLAPNSLHHGFF